MTAAVTARLTVLINTLLFIMETSDSSHSLVPIFVTKPEKLRTEATKHKKYSSEN